MEKICLLVIFILSTQIVDGQTTVDEKVKAIRQEYQKINSNLSSYKKMDVYYTDPAAYWNNRHYTGFLNSKNELDKLTFSIGEEGYWSNYEYCFKNGEVFFIFIHSGQPDGSEKQQRIYIWNKTIINALLKEKTVDDNRKISEIENKRDDTIMENVTNETRNNLQGLEVDVSNFYKAMNN
jgi:hypothetical protein